MKNEIYWKNSYNLLKRYCKTKLGLEIREGYNEFDMVQRSKKLITICTRQKWENRLYALLHEAGHFLLENGRHHIWVYGLQFEHGERNIENRTMMVGEEFAAWDKGLLIAKRLKISINRKNYEKNRVGSLVGYMKWALKQK